MPVYCLHMYIKDE